VVVLCAGDLAHGVVEGQAEHLDMEVNGVAGEVALRPSISPKAKPEPVGPKDLDTLEDVFATIQLPIGLLNMDYAGNNVRNIAKAREVLATPARASGKQQSELKLLGFMRGGSLTDRDECALRRSGTCAGRGQLNIWIICISLLYMGCGFVAN
jgi:hypothetical protein